MTLPTVEGYDIRITQIVVTPKGQPTYSEMATTIEIDDEALGEFVTLKQNVRNSTKLQISIEPNELNALQQSIEFMVRQCRSET